MLDDDIQRGDRITVETKQGRASGEVSEVQTVPKATVVHFGDNWELHDFEDSFTVLWGDESAEGHVTAIETRS